MEELRDATKDLNGINRPTHASGRGALSPAFEERDAGIASIPSKSPFAPAAGADAGGDSGDEHEIRF